MDHMHRRFGWVRRLIQNQQSQRHSNIHGIKNSPDMKQSAANKISQLRSILPLHNEQKQREHEQQHIHLQPVQQAQSSIQKLQKLQLQQFQQMKQFQDGQAEATESLLSILGNINTGSTTNNNGNSVNHKDNFGHMSMNSATNNSNHNHGNTHSDLNVNATGQSSEMLNSLVASRTCQQNKIGDKNSDNSNLNIFSRSNNQNDIGINNSSNYLSSNCNWNSNILANTQSINLSQALTGIKSTTENNGNINMVSSSNNKEDININTNESSSTSTCNVNAKIDKYYQYE